MKASDIPEDDLEITASVVRRARAAPPGARAAGIRQAIVDDFPDATDETVRRCFGHAARMLSDQHAD